MPAAYRLHGKEQPCVWSQKHIVAGNKKKKSVLVLWVVNFAYCKYIFLVMTIFHYAHESQEIPLTDKF